MLRSAVPVVVLPINSFVVGKIKRVDTRHTAQTAKKDVLQLESSFLQELAEMSHPIVLTVESVGRFVDERNDSSTVSTRVWYMRSVVLV